MLANIQKDVFPEDTQKLMEAGFLTECGKLSDSAREYLTFLNYHANKKALVKRAEERIAEAKANAK